MGALFQIVAYSIGNLFLGILLTVVGVILLFVLIQSWYRNSTFTPVSYIVGGILFLFLSFQSILLCGAVTIKSYSEDVECAINSWVAEVPSDIPFNQEDSQHVLEQITEEWPLVGYFVGGADFTGHTSVTIAQAMAEELRSFMNYFILRRVGWSLLFIVCGVVIVIKSMERVSRRRYSSTRSMATGSSRRRRYDD
jgi:hypothetical protein